MASISNDPNGRRRILFVAPDGSRKTIRLGKIDRKGAEAINRHVEALLSAKIGGQPIPRDTAAWITGIGEELKEKLSAVGLLEAPRREVPLLHERAAQPLLPVRSLPARAWYARDGRSADIDLHPFGVLCTRRDAQASR